MLQAVVELSHPRGHESSDVIIAIKCFNRNKALNVIWLDAKEGQYSHKSSDATSASQTLSKDRDFA